VTDVAYCMSLIEHFPGRTEENQEGIVWLHCHPAV